MPSGRCCCCAARRAASPSSVTAPRPGTVSRRRGTNGSSALGFDRIDLASLTINYRTPAEVMAEAEPVIRAALPDANVPTSIRTAGIPVVRAPKAQRDSIVEAWLTEHAEGIACVIGDPTFAATTRVRSLTPVFAKGLEFDLVVLDATHPLEAGIEAAVDRYVAMTRATQQLVVLE